MKSRNSQLGSSHVIIIVLLVVLLLGALGYIFWQNFSNQPSNETTTNSDTTQTAPESPEGTELSIAEWGVKGSYQSSETIGYRIDNFNVARVYYAEDVCSSSGFGYISRGLAEDDAVVGSGPHEYTTQEAFETGLGNARSKVGEYYFLYTGPSAPCGDEDEARLTEATDAVKQLVSSFEAA